MCHSVCQIFPQASCIPKTIQSLLENVGQEFAAKYMDELLKKNGLILWGNYRGCYFVFFETVDVKDNFILPLHSDERHLRFKIEESNNRMGSDEDLTNVKMILKNKDGFELKSVNVGTIKKHGWVTGDFKIREIDYKKISKIYLITDQDR